MKSDLSIELSKLEGFREPKISLEQYMTPPELAADIIHSAYMNGDIEGKNVLDLGTGTGILGIGAALAGAKKVLALEKDKDAIKIAEENIDSSNMKEVIELLHADIEDFNKDFDTVVMNPPFSTHSDTGTIFVSKALKSADSVYAIGHPGLEEEFRRESRKTGHEVHASEEYTISLPATYGFHTQDSRETEVRVVVARR